MAHFSSTTHTRTANKPTASSSEAPIGMAEGTMPWQQEGGKGNAPDEHSKYGYHPGGDPSRGVKDAPSALHTTIIPNVRLTRVCSPHLTE